jgi:RND family efflux transporter MFP subunit
MLFDRVPRPLAWRAVWLLVAGPLGLSACQGEPANGAGGAGGRGAMPPMPVGIETLAPRPVEQATEFVATVKSRRSSTIQPQVEGFITRIHVTSGQRVSPGTPLFDIDAATQQAAVAGLESVRAARQADAAYARQQAERAKALRDVGAMSEQEYEAALTLQKTAEAQLQAVEQQIRQQRAELSYYRVTAPASGIVGDVPVRVGDRVTRATMLTTLSDNSAGLELYINVPVQEATRLKPGLRVVIVGDHGQVIGTEQVNFVSPNVDDATQTVLVKAPITRGQYRSDQFVRTRIVWSTEPTLVIPLTSVMRVSGQYFAYVAEGAEGALIARQRAVVLGPVVGNAYVVLDGLRAGDRLIVSGIQKIGDGSPVQPAPPEGGGAGRGDAGRGGRGGE